MVNALSIDHFFVNRNKTIANKNSSFKSDKRPKTKSNAFNNLNKIVIAFNITIMIISIKRVKNFIFE